MVKKSKVFTYNPDYAIAPGETLSELLEQKGMTQADLALRTGRPEKTINEIVKGKTAITPETAIQFEKVLGVSAGFWNNLEKNYRETLARLDESGKLKEHIARLKELPIKELIKAKWIRGFDNMIDQLREALSFFGVASTTELDSVTASTVAFRKSKVHDTDPWVLAAWLRKGEIEAQNVACQAFDINKFREDLEHIKALTRVEFDTKLLSEWKRLCADAGVALIFVKELPGLRVNGATYWLTGKPVIQLSLRHKRDDILWFTFFHEAGHIINHGRKEVFIEQKDMNDEREKEADEFACNFLIPKKEYDELVEMKITEQTVNAFSSRIGVNSGIVVGRLQHDKKIPVTWLNRLKLPLKWVDD